MIRQDRKRELTEEFRELGEPKVVLAKEVYAHFGLLFFKFSLIEHSLINILLFHHLGTEIAAKRIRSKACWERAHDEAYDNAKRKTFGNLVRSVSKIPEFSSFSDELSKIKEHRDYFAHHFFREEVGVYMGDEGCWQLLWAIKVLRDRLILLEEKLKSPMDLMCKRLGLALPSEQALQRAAAEIINESKDRLRADHPFQWTKPTK